MSNLCAAGCTKNCVHKLDPTEVDLIIIFFYVKHVLQLKVINSE